MLGPAFGYLIPKGRSYVAPVLTADRRSLHIEARYNYEDLETGSLCLGRNFSFGTNVTLELTPMIGGVFGSSTGVAPGYLLSLAYRRLSLESEGEYSRVSVSLAHCRLPLLQKRKQSAPDPTEKRTSLGWRAAPVPLRYARPFARECQAAPCAEKHLARNCTSANGA